MTRKREYHSGKARQGRLDEQAGRREAAQKLEDDAVQERVRKSIEEHGA